jgi:hypothetical protein
MELLRYGPQGQELPGILATDAGYVMVNDVSERRWQIERRGQWSKGKSFDTFTPVGPWLASASEPRDWVARTDARCEWHRPSAR